MNIEKLTKDEMVSHLSEILDNQISRRDHNRTICLAVAIGIALGLCA